MMVNALEAPSWLEKLLQRPIAVLGHGVSGKAACDLAKRLGAQVEIFDEKSELAGVRRRFDLEIAKDFALVIYSPGFEDAHPWMKAGEIAGCQMMPEFDFGSIFWRGSVIAITGTNGKTTLTEFLTKAFNSAGIEAYAVGNIGQPLSGLLASDCNLEAIAVCEVSSFQSAHLSHLAADHVLWSNFDEDHLDRHESLKEYFGSKYNLVRNARADSIFVGEGVMEYARRFDLELRNAIYVETNLDSNALGISGTEFEDLPERNSYLMARALWLQIGLSENELIEAAHSFKKSPHRMELIDSFNGVSFWDDSKATNFHAVLGGLSRFSDRVIWIGGGKDKGGDIEGFTRRLVPKIAEAHVIGETAPVICRSLEEHGIDAQVYDSMEAAVRGAYDGAASGSTIMLSPGFSSFDMFEGYSNRGEAFRKAVATLEKKSDDFVSK